VQATFAATAGSVASEVTSSSPAAPLTPLPTPEAADPLADFIRLRGRLMLATVSVSVVAVAITWAAFGGDAARSLFFGSCCGLLYLRLLARSVARLGPDSRSLGRVQLLVPALLVIASSRIPALHLLPAFIGFVLYKPALLLQAFLAP